MFLTPVKLKTYYIVICMLLLIVVGGTFMALFLLNLSAFGAGIMFRLACDGICTIPW